MTQGIYIQDLVVEVTRRCDIRCDHCLRGEVQYVDLNPEYVDALCKQLSHVGYLSITGGEPSLAVPQIRMLRKSLIKYNVQVDNFYIATNAHHEDKEFIFEIMEWYAFCTDNEVSAVQISNDIFHEQADERQVRLLSALSFFSFREDYKDNSYYARKSRLHWDNIDMVIKQGRGGEIGGTRILSAETFEVIDDEGQRSIEQGSVYLNCLGKIVGGCDWSYENQELQTICDVTDDIWQVFYDLWGE